MLHSVAIHLESKLRAVYAHLSSRQALFGNFWQESSEKSIFANVFVVLRRLKAGHSSTRVHFLNIRQPEIIVEIIECWLKTSSLSAA